MGSPRLVVASIICVPLATVALLLQPTSFDSADATSEQGGLVTLYANDPIASTFSFSEGAYGRCLSDGMVRSRGGEIDFGVHHANELTVGISGGSDGTIVDLGGWRELATRYGYKETVGGGQGFASIRSQGRSVRILKDYRAQSSQEVVESAALLSESSHLNSHAPVGLGHVYLVRLVSETGPVKERRFKLIVVGHVRDQSVTFRWARI